MTNVVGAQTLFDACLRARHPAGRAHRHRRGVRVDRRGIVDRGVAAAAQLAVLGGQGERGAAGARVLRDLRDEHLDDPLLEQLRAVPVPGEGHPAVRHEPDGRKKVPLYGDGLNVRDWLHVDDHCRGHPDRRSRRASRRVVQHRRRPGDEQQGTHPAPARRHGCDLGHGRARRGSQGSRPPLLPQTTAHCGSLGYAPQHTFEDGLRRRSTGTRTTRTGGGRSRRRQHLRDDALDDHRRWRPARHQPLSALSGRCRTSSALDSAKTSTSPMRRRSVSMSVRSGPPNVVINAAAYTAVDAAET